MTKHNRYPMPNPENPVELELMAIHALSAPETLQIQLLTLGAVAVASAIESAIKIE